MKKNVEQPVHNQQFNEEIKLKEEIKEMQGKVNQLRKNRSTIDDYKNLINEIKSLTIKYEEKPNKGEKPQKQIREEVNPIKNFDKQIEFIQSKKNLTPAEKIKYYENLDGRLMLKKKKGRKEEFKENVQLFSKQIPQIGTLLERVNSELLVQKFHFIEDLHKNEDLGKESEHKVQENLHYIELFKEVLKEIESKIERLSDKDTYEEAENIKEKCLNEFQNFTQNTLKEITTSNLDIQQNIHPTLVDFTFSSSNNLVKLSEKIKNLQIHSRSNKLGKNVLEMFNTNILFAHQNNYLLNYILNRLVSPSYEQTLDKVLIYSNPNNFNEMKHKIETFKNFNEIDEKNNNVLNYSQIEELNSDDENN